MSIFDDMESKVRVYPRSFPAMFDRASGYHIFDVTGKKWIDFLMCAGSLNYGHNPPEMVEAVVEYLRNSGVVSTLDLETSAKAQFLETFRDIILRPRQLDYVLQFVGPTGTNAVEAALKLARLSTGRRQVVAFTNGYHGVSLGALATTANGDKRAAAGVSLGDVSHLPYDGYLPGIDTLAMMEEMLSDPGSGIDPPAAVLLETVQGEGGLRAAGPEWLARVADITRRNGALLIVDDIQAGCGRTGTFFSFEPAGLKPDIVCMSKSIGGMGLPMSIVLIRRGLDIWQPGQHNGTFRGNNLAFVAGRVALEEYWRSPTFAQQVQLRASLLDGLITELVTLFPGRIAGTRGRGLMRGLVFADAGFAQAVSEQCFEDGLICETCGSRSEVVKLLPPLTIDESGISIALSILRRAITAVERRWSTSANRLSA